MTDETESASVTQADRDAAADFRFGYASADERAGKGWVGDHYRWHKSGNCDDDRLIQAFARHRLAGFEAGERSRSEIIASLEDEIAATRPADRPVEVERLLELRERAREPLKGWRVHDGRFFAWLSENMGPENIEYLRYLWLNGERLTALAHPPATVASPIPMLLFCPVCHVQHIDEPDERTPEWDNPPHRSHLCHSCGCIWRPADLATEGVRAIGSVGKADTWTLAALTPAEALDWRSRALEADEPRLIESKSDADCGCPEELWEAYGAHLHMHLAAGRPSNAHADFGDDGECECEVIAATVDQARGAFFGWARSLTLDAARKGRVAE